MPTDPSAITIEHGSLSGRVTGVVRSRDGSTTAGVGVVLLGHRLRATDLALGKTETGADGSYSIAYRVHATQLDLVVRVSHGTEIISSSVIMGAGPDEVVDLVLGGTFIGPSDYASLQLAVVAALADSGAKNIADFTEIELAMLAAKSGVDPAELVLLRQSDALAATTKLSSALFYAFGRQHIPLALPAIVTTGPNRRRDAIAHAISDNQVPASMATQLQAELAKLDQIVVAEALREPSPGESTLGSLFAAAGIAADKRATLVASHVKASGDTPAFWKQVRDSGTLTAAESDGLQDTLRLDALVLGHTPLVVALKAQQLATPADLARLEKSDWQRLVASAGMPTDLAAAGLTPAAYVDRIAAAVEEAVPTACLAARASHLPASEALGQFLTKNPGYDIRATSVTAFVRVHPDALAFLPSAEARQQFTNELKRIERTFRLAPSGARLQTMEILLADGIDSARRVRSMGRAAFMRRYAGSLGGALASAVWARASQISATASTLVARHGAAFEGAPIRVLPTRIATLQQLPDYGALFGSVDACSCGDCQSLYSPAAYLTDVLHWLSDRVAGTGSAADILLAPARRGDLGTIELSCPNTTTALPQIDLAIEVLEGAVASLPSPPAYQTRGTSDDLRVQPEHQNDAAYTILAGADPTKDAVYPFALPYDLWLDEARTYLGQLGVSRAELMASLHVDPPVSAESLGMSALEWDVIAGKPVTPPRAPATFWGATNDPDWVKTLSTVSTFLTRAMPGASRDTAYAALTELLRADFVQAVGDLGIWFDGASCDTTKATLVGLGVAHLDRLHRFVRLQRRLGWTVADLDRAIMVLGGGVLDEALLQKVAAVDRLRVLGLDLTELLTWWSPIDTRRWSGRMRAGRPAGIPATTTGTGLVFSRALTPTAGDGAMQSPYDARFLSRSVGAATDPAFSISADGTALADETVALADHAAAVAAALGITASDLGALANTLASDRLTLGNLSQLFRHASLARALGLTIANLSRLLGVTGATAFTTPASAIAFVDDARLTRASSVSLDELAYLLRDIDTKSLAPSDTTIGVLLLAMRDALRRVPIDHPDLTTQDQAARSIVIDKLSATLGLDPAIVAPLVETYVRSPIDNTASALSVYVGPSVVGYQVVDATTGAPVVPTATDLPAAFATYRKLAKVALLLTRLHIGRDELAWVCRTFDVNAPSYSGWQRLRDGVALRDGMSGKQLFDLFDRAAIVQTSGDASQIAAAHAALVDELAVRGGWPRADLAVLIGEPAAGGQPARPSSLELVYPTDWVDARGLQGVRDAMTTLTRIGLAAETVVPWRSIPSAIDARQAQAEAIRQAVRARHDDAQWRAIAGPLRDTLRERQRDALVAWLCAHDDRFGSVEDVSNHFLIDVQISPCQLTSRLRQAMSSTQQFVQRALLALEPEVTLSVDEAAEWTWMKTYRVWEANRKIFLYPENWIDPTLRDDKTPLFESLEAALAQGDMTSDAAEAAVLDYLLHLDELARLEVVATLHETGEADILHVFGRTRNTPPVYYYRQRLDGNRWTAWQTVDAGVDGNHLVPALFQGRLYVFWPQFSETAVEAIAATATAPERFYQIRLAWSRYHDGRWLGRKLSTVQVGGTEADYLRNGFGLAKTADSSTADFFFRTYEASGDLMIEPVRRARNPRDHSDNPAFAYFHIGRFRLSGCDGSMSLDGANNPSRVTMRLPPDMRTTDQTISSLHEVAALALPDRNPSTSAYEIEVTLGRTDGPFAIVPQTVDNFLSQDSFFVQDRRRTFLVAPVVRRWVRPPPIWLSPDEISIEPRHLFPLLGRPEIPRPDPWLVDAHSVARPAARIVSTPSTVSAARDGKLLGTDVLADSLGARVAYVGAESVTPRSVSLAVLGQTEVRSAMGELLASLRSPGVPTAASGLRTLTIGQTYTMPAIEVADPIRGTVLTSWGGILYRFEPFYHPYVCRLLRQAQRFGVAGLLDPSPTGPEPLIRRQQLSQAYFSAVYAPVAVETPFPADEFDLSFGGAYSAYNWEVFFHIPFAIACRLSTNQQFESAQRWFHYIFDPTESSQDLPAPQRFWKFRPFFEMFNGETAETGPIAELLLLLDYAGTDPARLAARDEVLAQIAAWRVEPFRPDAIARLRLVAYAKAVVMKYIDNLIAWGDHLFAQDTLETINEATQLYVLAAQILGPRPATIATEPPQPRTFDQLRTLGLDAFGDSLVDEVESYLPDVGDPGVTGNNAPAPLGPSLYFCVPRNDKLLAETWDRVADRLFKIRHCLDITGKFQQLPLFDPPIDPGLLVRASSAGIDLASALRDVTAPQPIHRYVVLVQKANELCSEVRGLGQMMLGTLEKQDGEALALLRADHEVKLLSAMRQVREQQVAEANTTLDGLRSARNAADVRVQYYRSRVFMNAAEKLHASLSVLAGLLDGAAAVALLLGSVTSQAPDGTAGGAGFASPLVALTFGGTQLHNSNQSMAGNLETTARLSDRAASVASLFGGYQRRMDDWQFQGDVAEQDRAALDKQIIAAEIRVAMTERELANLDVQIAQAHEVDDQMRSKFTSQELYTWMVGQLASIYFQGYQLAYAVAKRAERAWQFELAKPETSFIQFGYWDSLKKGLLAGERLGSDLRRMEVAYLDQNRREYELTAHISLRLLDPMSLEKLRTDGECFVSVPELWYDLDSPGHYLRRIKNVAISVPCVTGPYVPLRCTLTLLSSTVRTDASTASAYPRTGASDPRFRDDALGLQSIVTSRALEDTGLFETSLRDERYLPFEGAGAVGQWHLELPRQFRQFDYDTISDVVIHVRYTARDGGAALRTAAETALLPMLKDLAQGISLREEMPDLLYQLLHPAPEATGQQIAVPLTKDRFPYMFHGNTLAVTGIDVFLAVADLAGYKAGAPVRLGIAAPTAAPQPIDLVSAADFGGVAHGALTFEPALAVGSWTLAFDETQNTGASPTVVTTTDGHRRLDPAAIRDIILVVRYQAT